jgi:hypothetical protein
MSNIGVGTAALTWDGAPEASIRGRENYRTMLP